MKRFCNTFFKAREGDLYWVRVSTETDGDHTTGEGHYMLLTSENEASGTTTAM